MTDSFKFETFVDVHSGVFEEYLSSIGMEIAKDNPEYRAVKEKITGLYEQYPRVLAMLDSEKSCDLNEQECKVLVEILGLRNQLYAMESETIYFRGCYDGVGYLKKAGIL